MGRKVGIDPESIVEAAATIADADGLEAVTLARVAADLGVRSPSLYNHVGGLDDLRGRLRLLGLGEFSSAVRVAPEGNPADQLRAIAGAARRFAQTRPGLYAATQIGVGENDGVSVREADAGVVELVAEPIRALGVADGDIVHAVRAFRALLHGFADLEASGGFGQPVDVDESFRQAVDRLIDGLCG